MEEKMLDLMTKMYSEFVDFKKETRENFSEIKKDVTDLKQDVTTLKADVSDLKQDVTTLKADVSGLKQDVKVLKNDVVRIENKMGGLYDAFQVNQNSIQEIKSTVKLIAQKVDRHDIKIQVIEGGKKSKGKTSLK